MPHSNCHRRPTLSVSMIVKNEEAFLDDCLQSVQPVADEIVIVDTGSTDRTKEIARGWGTKVFDFAWQGDFAAARNFSLQQCTGDWVLYIDADERLTAKSAQALPRLLSRNEADAYTVIIDSPQTMRQGRFKQQNAYPRLFRRFEGIAFEGRVHEQVLPSLQRQRLKVLPSSVTILHLGYDRGYDVVKKKAERNLELLQRQLAVNPGDAYTQFQVGNTLVVLQRYDEAESILDRALRNPHLDRSNRASCYNLMAEVAVRRGDPHRAVQMCMRSLEAVPIQMMARWFLALLYFDLQEFDQAIRVLEEVAKLLDEPSTVRLNHIASDLDLRRYRLELQRAMTYAAAGKMAEAADRYLAAIEEEPSSREAVEGFLRCVDRIGESVVGLRLLERAALQCPKEKHIHIALARRYHERKEFDAAFHHVDCAMALEPEDGDTYALAIKWKMELGATEEAWRYIEHAEACGVQAFEFHKASLQLSLSRGDLRSAFKHLELMAQTSQADLTPLRNRLAALAAKISSQPSA